MTLQESVSQKAMELVPCCCDNSCPMERRLSALDLFFAPEDKT